jgi:hypothetical protein
MRSMLKASRLYTGGLVLSAVSAAISCRHRSLHSLAAGGLETAFLICLKQKSDRYPYFALWVGNAELLVKRG